MAFKMKGVIPPMVTPFDKEGNLDEKSLRTLVRFLKEKVDGLFVCGSYGCGPMMNLQERKRVMELAKEEADGIPVIGMVGTTTTRETIELALYAKKIGLDAVTAVVPYYYHHTMDDVVGFYRDIIDAVGKDYPVYIYTNPKFSGYDVDLKTLHRLYDLGLHGIKAAAFDIMAFANIIRSFEGTDFDIALGTEALWLPASVYGAKAFIPGLSNAYPEICRQMYEESQRGDYEACRKTQFKVNKIRDVMHLAPSTQMATYAMLKIRGVVDCYPRKPFTGVTPEQFAQMRAALVNLGMPAR